MNNSIVKYKLIIFGLISLILEVLSQTVFYNQFPHFNPILWFLSSISTAVLLYKIANSNLFPPINPLSIKVEILWIMIVFILTSSIIVLSYWVFQKYPNNYLSSDIVPSLEFYVKRFLNKENPYYPIDFNSWKVVPNYYPMRWIPFIFSEILKIDYRWTSVWFFLAISFIIFKQEFDQNKSRKIVNYCILSLSLGVFLLHIIYLKESYAFASEYIIVSFYLWFSYKIKSWNIYYSAFALVLCLTSRYVFLFWLPLYCFVLLNVLSIRNWIKHLGIIFILFLIIIVPFFIYHESYFLTEFYNYKNNGLIGLWTRAQWQSVNEVPFHLNHGFSFMIFFYEWVGGNIVEKYNWAKKIQLISNLSFTCISLWYYFKNTITQPLLFLLVTLKISIVLFYSLLPAPFPYLYILPFYINIILLYKIVDTK